MDDACLIQLLNWVLVLHVSYLYYLLCKHIYEILKEMNNIKLVKTHSYKQF